MTYALENVRIGLQLVEGTIALADNMIINTKAWLAFLSGQLDGSQGNPTLSQIEIRMNTTANKWSAIINRVQTWGANNTALATAALNVFGVRLSAANSDLNNLKTIVSILLNADKTSIQNTQNACNALLLAVPQAPSVF